MAESALDREPTTRGDWFLLVGLSLVPVLFHLVAVASRDYGYFIDEFYYIACAKRLAWGYVDHPPFAPALLAASRVILGDSVLGIRLLPFLAAGATVWVTGLLAWRFGGGRYAMIVAGLGMGLSGLLAMTGFFSMNAFEPLLWSLAVLTLVRLVQTGNSRLWLLVGALIGLAFENKHTIVAYVLALAVGVVLTRTRRVLRDPWLWAGAGLALAFAMPNVLWQVANGWPSLEFYRNAQLLKNQPSPPHVSLLLQVLVMNPVALPVWLSGVGYLLFARDARDLRFLGLMYVVLLVMHVLSQSSRPDRMLAAYPMLMAAGAVVVERSVRNRAWRVAVPAAVTASALLFAPITLPLLPPPVLARYVSALGFEFSAERGKTSSIPQLLADRTGWESYVAEVERVFQELPRTDQEQAIIYAPSYGHAGAVELWGQERGLPGVISGQNTYWHWSEGRTDSRVLIAVDFNSEVLRRLFDEVREAGRIRCEYCMSWRSNMPIFVARGPKVPMSSIWARVRHYE